MSGGASYVSVQRDGGGEKRGEGREQTKAWKNGMESGKRMLVASSRLYPLENLTKNEREYLNAISSKEKITQFNFDSENLSAHLLIQFLSLLSLYFKKRFNKI